MQVAADHRLRLVALGHRHRLDAARAGRDVDEAAHEVDEVRALQQQLRHHRVVVAGRRDVAVGAGLGFGLPHRVRHVRVERLTREPFGRHGLLLRVDLLTAGVLGADDDRARRTHRRDPVAGHRAVDAEHEDIVAQHLEVIRRPVPRRRAFVVQHRPLLVRGLRQMAAEAARHPRRVAGVAGHSRVGVRQAARRVGAAPAHAVALHGLGEGRARVVARMIRIERIGDLRNRPLQAVGDHRALDDDAARAAGRHEARIAERRHQIGEVGARLVAARRRRAGCPQRRARARRAVAVDAVDLDRVARLAVEVAVAVAVLREVAVDAVHAASRGGCP